MADIKLASSQALDVYNLLCGRGALSAREIGAQLGILQNAVYRSCEQLERLGVVREVGGYPRKSEVVANNEALGLFLMYARKQFRGTFGEPGPGEAVDRPAITFIKMRDELLRSTDKDTARATTSVNFIVSGLEVPNSTILAYRKAIINGVKIRALLQKRHDTSRSKLERWQDIGVHVKYTSDLGVRLFIFDSNITYFTSYNEGRKDEALGIRFSHSPLAVLMNAMFEEYWAKARD